MYGASALGSRAISGFNNLTADPLISREPESPGPLPDRSPDFALELCFRHRDPLHAVREFRFIGVNRPETAFKLPLDFIRRRTPCDALRHRDAFRVEPRADVILGDATNNKKQVQ